MADINDIIIKDDYESEHDFEMRKKLTLLIANNQYYKLNNVTSVEMARLYMNKFKLGVTYNDEIENILNTLQSYVLNIK